jgi:hypothetical protein
VRYNGIMFILGILSWWYGAGWRRRAMAIREQLTATIDFFSIDLLLRTLFSPFRQISAGKVRGPIGVQLQAFFDRLVSRLIGGMVRSFMVLMGVIAIFLNIVIGFVLLIVWGTVPLLPIAGIGLFAMGWIPWSL